MTHTTKLKLRPTRVFLHSWYEALASSYSWRQALAWRLLAVALLLVAAPSASAHEIGKTQVTATFRSDDTYAIEMAVDPDALLAKLEALAGVPASGATNPVDRGRRIDALKQTFLSRTTVAFDGATAQPQFDYVEAQAGVIRLTGPIPPDARMFTWRSTLVFGSYALVVKTAPNSDAVTQWLEGGRESDPFPIGAALAETSRVAIARQYLALGFTHILPKGLDHILFVLGIFLLTTKWRSVLAQVTAFTVAHSITLGLTIYGVLSLPTSIVEPLIALSIAYVAIENLVTSELKPWRVALVFCFGLLHGMGFAGVLRELGLPRSEFMTALVTFNIGVEGGQLAVIGLAAFALAYWRSRDTYRRLIVVPASLTIAAMGVYWTIQRVWYV